MQNLGEPGHLYVCTSARFIISVWENSAEISSKVFGPVFKIKIEFLLRNFEVFVRVNDLLEIGTIGCTLYIKYKRCLFLGHLKNYILCTYISLLPIAR